MKTSEPPIIVSHTFSNPLKDVWNAITQVNQMREWYFDNIPEFKAEVGFKTQFNVKAPSRDFLHVWEVIEVVSYEKLTYKWNFEGLPGASYSIFELEAKNAKTKLTLTTEIIEDFDDTIPEFRRESCLSGWNYFIKERLPNYFLKFDS